MSELLVAITVFNLALYFFVATVVVRRKRKNKAQWRFLLLVVLSAIWVFLCFLQGFEIVSAVLLTHINFCVAALIAGAMASFALHYPIEFSKKKYEVWLWIPIVILAVLSFTKLFVKPITFMEGGDAPLYILYISILAAYFLLITMGLFLWKYRRLNNVQKIQIRFFLVAYGLAIITQLAESIYINTLGSLSVVADRIIINISMFFIGSAVYAILKYRFLDIGLTIQRSAVRFLVFIVLFAVYLFVILFAKQTYLPQDSSSQLTFLVIITLFVVLTMEPLRKLIYKNVDRYFGEYDNRKQRNEKRMQILATARDGWKGLVTSVEQLLKDRFKVSATVFIDYSGEKTTQPNVIAYLRETGKIFISEEIPFRLDEDIRFANMEKELRNMENSMFIPIGVGSSFIGYFALGARKVKKPYTVQEVEEALAIQLQLSEALFNARLYHQAVERIRN